MARYWFLLRPPFIGTHPTGEIGRQAFTPAVEAVITGGEKVVNHGYVDYPEPLDLEQIWRYDLLPDDPAVRAFFRMWLYCDRDKEDAWATIEDYRKLSVEELETQATEWYNDYARLTLQYLRATAQA